MVVSTHFDVIIVGLGPTGAALANVLGQNGLSVCVLEKDATIYPLPRAIHFDGEVMRFFQSLGLRAEIEAISRPGLTGMHFVNAQGETLLIRGGVTANGPHGCANNYYFHQPELEQVLRQGLERFPNVQVLLQSTVHALHEQESAVTVDYSFAADAARHSISAAFVVGCDGARSLVRRTIGSTSLDLGLHQPWLVFDVILHEAMPSLPEFTVQHCNPERPMTYCYVTGLRRRWEIMLMPGDDPEKMVTPDIIWGLVSPWLTPNQADIERAVIYTFHSVIAQGWRKNRLLLAGDSAHQTPPFLGQGMCAGIRDVANLAWKLSAVIQGRACDSLLDTYESERTPHVHAFIDLAVRLGDIIQTTDPQAARERDEKFRAGQPEIFSFPSPPLGPSATVGAHPLVGRPFWQPRLADGQLLDTKLGQRFGLIARADLLGALTPAQMLVLKKADVVQLSDTEPVLHQCLEKESLAAILLRPDRYVAATAANTAQLGAMLKALPL
jgi:3-(3-hydroxy-phenyl)propionate hydroxylase